MKRAEEAAAKAQPDDKEEEEETEKDQLERETRELAGQLKKVERQEALSRDKEEREQAKRYSKWIQGGAFLKQTLRILVKLIASLNADKQTCLIRDTYRVPAVNWCSQCSRLVGKLPNLKERNSRQRFRKKGAKYNESSWEND